MSSKSTDHTAAAGTPSVLALYLAGGLGALCLGIGDLLNNEHAATVLKLGQVLREYLYPGLESGAIIALLVLMVLGCIICWIQQPATRADAFARGFSLFAVLAVVTPYQSPNDAPTAPTGPHAMLFSNAYAAGSEIPTAPTGWATVYLKEAGGVQPVPYAKAFIRDPQSAKVLEVSQVQNGTLTVQRPVGTYTLEIEAPGFQRTSVSLSVTETKLSHTVEMNKSSLPLGIQRLYAPSRAAISAQ